MLDELKCIIREAGGIFKDGYYKSKDIHFKGKKDLVTQYDVQVENFLKQKFQIAFSDFDILAEESNNGVYDINNTIIIDPIDGTTNFVNNVPFCAISVGVYRDKKPFIGVVYNPITDEMYYAQKNQGAFCNNEQIKVSDENIFQSSLIATGFPYTSNQEEDLSWILDKIKKVLPKCQDIRRLGSASMDLCMVAKGVFEGYYEIGLKPWDISAGMIIVQEAGGIISDIDNNDFDVISDGCIVASNSHIHKEFIYILNNS
jgi:myo-inositol-1(or 4)-monophosphatase